MLTRALRTLFLFAAYSSLGVTGDYLAAALAKDAAPGPRRVVRVESKVVVPADRIDRQVGQESCPYRAERRVNLAAPAGTTLRLRAGAGELRVEGKEGLSEVHAVGIACATDSDDLDHLQLDARRSGDRIVLETRYPNHDGFRVRGRHVARIDLTVEVPMGMAADIEDGSGSMDVSGTGELKIEDGSGSMDVHDIRGAISIDDGSGGIEVSHATSSLHIEDGSGGISIRDVAGRIDLDDGSGGIDVTEAGSDVVVEDDGSGSITVSDVRGDFSVLSDGSGSIHYSHVSGSVHVPRDKRGRR